MNISGSEPVYGISVNPEVKMVFSEPVDLGSLTSGIALKDDVGNSLALNFSPSDGNKIVVAASATALNHLSKFELSISQGVLSDKKSPLKSATSFSFITRIDSAAKFPELTDDELLNTIQQQTFKYFWDYGHPVSGMARERSNGDDDIVTTGGTGFGIMSIIVGIERDFISREEGLERVSKITSFLKDKCTRFHGAFSHWINGATGTTVPFSAKDNGGDLVETSLLMQGLLCARQYFDGSDNEDKELRENINELWEGVDWDWYRQGQQVLYWHWSPDFDFQMDLKIQGWNESLITYVLAASSPSHTINKAVYDEGWAGDGSMKNGNSFFGITLPLGPPSGGPLFFAQYSFLGLNPDGLQDDYADYFEQNKAHTLINYNYCVANSKQFFGYSKDCWGLTASDDPNGYAAHSPTNDNGTISPTAAISSLPYTPQESMNAIRFFYYTIGDKLFKEYGFIDAFNLNYPWFAGSFLAIDQGPQIVMIENYRSGLLWHLFMSCPEVQSGLNKLGFTFQ